MNMTLQGNILIIDDEPIERGSMALMLQQEGYYVTAVADGLSALAQLESSKYDVIITDLKMPQMTGIGLIREIKARDIDSAVILVTSYGNLKDAINAIKAGAYDFIEKSQDMDVKLRSTVKQIMESHHQKITAS